ncbi:MAG: hypothetical protein OdinLCB4_007015 [Candidatus Odinarchaeum yellowstonii]|uniref:Uncharacterized protein n=1 Tax=Odinarchaeota yellowstonii (strain LCB_4) TaxID=1841599 RepID=A0AAF0IBS0_ODILC|nr:MAG: hypothetical protein OdinLCB4_007015 [Candidatus Odinarchaeum yellowstonii]
MGKKAAIAILIIIVAGVGGWLALSYPREISRISVNIEAAGRETHSGAMQILQTQIQLNVIVTASSALWTLRLYNSTGDIIWSYSALSTGALTVNSPWIPLTENYNIQISALGSLTGEIIVLGRGFPWTNI